MRRPAVAVAVVALVLAASAGATAWLLHELGIARQGGLAGDLPASSAPPALAPAGAADHLPDHATATPGMTGAIAGRVTGAGDRGLAGVRVQLASRADGAAGLRPIEVRTSFEGTFRFDGVEPGRAVLVAAQDGVALGVSRSAQVVAGRTVPVEIALPAAGVLEGSVGAAGGPTVVLATPIWIGPGGLRAARAPVDAAGHYRMALPAGEYRISAVAGDRPPTDLRTAPTFAAVPGNGAVVVDLVARSAPVEEGPVVRVLEPGGGPSPGAAVTVARAGEDRIAFAAAADEDGRLVLGSELRMDGAPVTLRARNGGRTGQFTGAIPAAGEVAIRLIPGGAVEGVLSGGGPVRGFSVEVEGEPAPGGWRTLDRQRLHGDRFDLGDLPPEPVRLTVRTDDGRVGRAAVTLAPGQRARLAIRLAPPESRVSAAAPAR